MDQQSSSVTLLLLALIVFASRLIISISVTPPWQQPDEPGHFEYATRFLGTAGRGQSRIDTRPIVKSMARHEWWRHRGLAKPEPLPSYLNEISESSAPVAGTLYYRVAGRVLDGLDRAAVEWKLYALRGLSALLAMLTLCVAWAGTSLALGRHGAVVTTMLLALHPQFTIVSTTVGADALLNLCGAAIWWQSVRLWKREPNWLVSASAISALALLAVVTRRFGAPLALAAEIVVLAAAARCAARRQWPARTTIWVFAIMLGLIAVTLYASRIEIQRLAEPSMVLLRRVAGGEFDWVFFRRFTVGLFESYWLFAGWFRYPAPGPWYVVMWLLTGASIVGLLVSIVRWDQRTQGATVALALLFVGLQVGAVYWVLFFLRIGPQGRYLFPVIVPALTILWLGFRSIWPAARERAAALALIMIMAAVDLSAWILVVIPAYL